MPGANPSAGLDVLTTHRDYYVRTDGNDANNGLTNTSGGAFLTIAKAVDATAKVDKSIHGVRIRIAPGTYLHGGELVGEFGMRSQNFWLDETSEKFDLRVTFDGMGTTAADVVILGDAGHASGYGYLTATNAHVYFRKLTLSNWSTYLQSACKCTFDNVVMNNADCYAYLGSWFNVISLTLQGSLPQAFLIYKGGNLAVQALTFVGNPTYSLGVLRLEDEASADFYNNTTGAFVGRPIAADANSTVRSYGVEPDARFSGTLASTYKNGSRAVWSGGDANDVWSITVPSGLKKNSVVLTAADFNLGNVTNTTDTNKPVSTAQQTALNLKANLASPTFTGTVGLPASQIVNGVTLTSAGLSTNFLTAAGTYAAAGVTGPAGAIGATGAAGAIGATGATGATGTTSIRAGNIAYAASLTVNVAALDHVRVGALTGNITALNLSGGSDGQRIVCLLSQDGTGGRTVALGASIIFSGDLPSFVASTGANKVDLLAFIYDATLGKYLFTSTNKGYN